MKKKKKGAITLIELMVVILIIGLISGVLAYNFKGSMDQGKIFKSNHGSEQIQNILMLEVMKGKNPEEVAKNWQEIILVSPLASKPKELIKDGFGEAYKVSVNEYGEIEVISEKAQGYDAQKASQKKQDT